MLPLSGEWIRRAALTAIPLRSFTEDFLVWLLEDWAAQDEAGRERLQDEVDFAYRAIRSFKLKRMAPPSVLSNAELQDLRPPTLFIVGENEKIYSVQRAVRRLRETVPHVATVVIPDAGHDLTVVQAERVNATIAEFLDRSAPSM